MKMLNIGFQNHIPENKIVAILSSDSAPTRRLISEAKDRGMLVNACYGRQATTVILTTSNYIILSAIDRKTLSKRVEDYE